MKKLIAWVVLGLLAFPSATSAATRQVTMQGTSFNPARVTALRGDIVRWTNTDLQQHNAVGAGFASPTLNPGQFWEHTFSSNGSFFYRCTIHPFMTGTVTVADLFLQGPVGPLAAGRSASFSGLAPENSVVTLERVGGGAVTTAQAGADGRFSAVVPGIPGQYRATAAGRTSAVVRVTVRSKATIAARRAGTRAVVTVAAKPNQRGGTVVLERRRGRGWARVGSKRLNTASKAVFRTAIPRGRTTFRARLTKPAAGYTKATTRSLTVRR
jgi:plastocyanin